MTLFKFSYEQSVAILKSLSSPVRFGTEAATNSQIIGAIEVEANLYLKRLRMHNVDGIKKRLDALKLVKSMLGNPSDDAHLARIARESDRWELELFLIERPKQRRARLRFMVDAFSVFASSDDNQVPLVELLALSDSNSAARRFFDAAIAPVCEAAGEPIEIRAAVNAFAEYKSEMRRAEIELIRACMEYAAKGEKS